MIKQRKAKYSKPRKQTARWLIVAALGTAAVFAVVALSLKSPDGSAQADVVVYKTATCSCCSKWVDHLTDNGLAVSVVNVRNTRAAQSRVGVPRTLGSCHTAMVGDYWVEGHVPADLIRRLMTEKPEDIQGLTVPGMPMGSPGMEGANPVQYDVLAVDAQGKTRIYATRQGEASPE